MADQIPYQRATLAPPVPVRTEFTTTGTLEASSQVDFAVCDFDANKTLDFLPKDWPDGSLLTVVLKDVDYTVTFEDYAGADKDTKNIEFPDGSGIPTLSRVADRVTFRWNKDDLLWRFEYANFKVPIYDSGWITAWGGTTIDADVLGAVTLSSHVGAAFPFNVEVWFRSTSAATEVHPINVSGIATTYGVQVKYDTTSRALTIYFQGSPYHYEISGVPLTATWNSGTGEIRVIIN
jgi:hypothetical protein